MKLSVRAWASRLEGEETRADDAFNDDDRLMCAGLLGAWLAWRDPKALTAVLAAWRQSLGAGFCGAAASGLWFTAMTLSPVGPVRAVGVVEMPIAAIAGRRLFKERLTAFQMVAGLITAIGVAMAALG